ncbi:Eco57I restriction-modification methylase domain-containing protein, partial [Mesonia sp.]|uniref:Eco57I restriction-modification methylase domain-containing protein n=1 Tax=Mesonia sp. TaxID=1960830 RepID=UPI0017724D36
SLVVDEEKPKPLPNLDYKIMQGNSLLESFEGIPLNNTNLFNAPSDRNITLFEEPEEDYGIGDDIKQLMDDYFNPKNYRKKQTIHKSIDKKVIDYIDKCLEGFENQKLIELAGAKQSLKRKTELQQKTQPILKEIEQIQETLNSKGNARKKLVEFEEKSSRPYFLWHLFFKDVFEDGGFDIVIGNPPYRQIKWLSDKKELENEGYDTFSKSGDIYCLFYEKADIILKASGVGIYITSNKWLRADYGKELRKYLIDKTNPNQLIDFAGYKVFETATVDTNILKWKKENYSQTTNTTVIDNSFDIKNTISDFIKSNSVDNEFSSDRQWLSISLAQLKIKNIIEKKSQVLSDIVNLNYGILTGANKTFLIDKKKYQELVLEDEKNQEILKPILRGKDLSQYSYEFKNVYLVNSHNGIKSKNISPVNIEQEYPTILEYFESFGNGFKQRGEQGDNWYNLRNCAYLEEFEKNKIIYADIVQERGKFFYDTNGFYTNDTAFIITGNKLKLLTAVLNSTIVSYAYKNFYSGGGLGDKGLRFKKEFLGKTPIPKQIDDESLFDFFVDVIQYIKLKIVQPLNETIKNEHISKFFEEVIDGCVFELYFKEHMLEKGINIIALVQQEIHKILSSIDFNELGDQTKNQKIWELYKNLKNSEVQQRMRLFVSKSPDILKPILQT